MSNHWHLSLRATSEIVNPQILSEIVQAIVIEVSIRDSFRQAIMHCRDVILDGALSCEQKTSVL